MVETQLKDLFFKIQVQLNVSNGDFTKAFNHCINDYDFDRNTRFISQASFDSTLNLVTSSYRQTTQCKCW